MKRKLLLLTTLMIAFSMAGLTQDPVVLTVSQSQPLLADAGDDLRINTGETVTIGGNPSASQGYGDYVYLWSPAEGLDDPTLANPSASPEVTTTYLLTVTDANNCSSTDEVMVTVGASAIETSPSGLNIRCYPNPVGEDLLIGMTGIRSDLKVRLISPLGKELVLIDHQAGGTSAVERIPMHDFPAGVYFLQVISSDTAIFQTIIKTR